MRENIAERSRCCLPFLSALFLSLALLLSLSLSCPSNVPKCRSTNAYMKEPDPTPVAGRSHPGWVMLPAPYTVLPIRAHNFMLRYGSMVRLKSKKRSPIRPRQTVRRRERERGTKHEGGGVEKSKRTKSNKALPEEAIEIGLFEAIRSM